jgi:hypothetical protein
MQKLIDIIKPALLAFAACVPLVFNAQGQATTQIAPRQYYVLSNVLDAASTNLKTNNYAYQPYTALNGTNQVGGWAPTFIPFSGAHAVGLAVQILNSNAYFANSNYTVTVFPAMDTGGGSTSSLAGRYGTNFGVIPLFTWTISYPASSSNWYTTNLPTTVWEPATSLGYWFSNAVASNITVNVIQSVAP